MINVDQLVELARESELTDPIDWSALNITEIAAYRMMASHVIGMTATSGPNKEYILMASLTKLLVENFVINLQLEALRKNN